MYQWNRSFNIPPARHTPGIWHLCRPGEEGIWLSESPRGGEFESISCEISERFAHDELSWQGCSVQQT